MGRHGFNPYLHIGRENFFWMGIQKITYPGGVFVAAARDNKADIYDLFWTDRNFVMATVQIDGALLEHAPLFQDDFEIALAALRDDPRALWYVSPRLKKNHDLYLVPLRELAGAIRREMAKMTPPRGDNEKIKEYRDKIEGILGFADESLKKDEVFVSQLVTIYGEALEWADPELQAKRENVLVAVRHDGRLLNSNKYAAQYQGDAEIVLTALREIKDRWGPYDVDVWLLHHLAANSLKEDEAFALEAVKISGFALQGLPKFQSHRGIVMEAVKTHGFALQYADQNFREDPEIVVEAVKQDGAAFQFAADFMKEDLLFCEMMVALNGSAFPYVSDKIKQAHPERYLKMAYAAVRDEPEVIRRLNFGHNSPEYEALCLEAIGIDSNAFRFVDYSLTQKREFVMKAIRRNPKVRELAERWSIEKQDAVSWAAGVGIGGGSSGGTLRLVLTPVDWMAGQHITEEGSEISARIAGDLVLGTGGKSEASGRARGSLNYNLFGADILAGINLEGDPITGGGLSLSSEPRQGEPDFSISVDYEMTDPAGEREHAVLVYVRYRDPYPRRRR